MTAINDVTKLDVIENVGVLTLNSPPVNALSANVREGLDIGIKKAIENNDVQAIVIICEGRTFIAGADDGAFEKLNRQIINLKLQDSVFLIGFVGFEDKKILLNNCDYFTLASEFESFGIAIVEALSCGKPIVLSNKTPWERLEKNKCGILVDNDKISFSNAFLKVTQQEYDSQLIKDYIKANYDWGIIADRFLASINNE